MRKIFIESESISTLFGGNTKLVLNSVLVVVDDITTFFGDTIVNPANSLIIGRRLPRL
ncbi:MAG: hypothetical protein QW552_03440 [Ignisphaera sp.]